MESDFHDPAMLATCYESLNDRENMLRVSRLVVSRAEKVIATDPGNGFAMGTGASAVAALGDEVRAREWIARAMLVDPDNYAMRYNLACAQIIYLKDMDNALDLLEPYFENASVTSLRHADIDPDIDPVRDMPRYQAMRAAAVQRLGLPADA